MYKKIYLFVILSVVYTYLYKNIIGITYFDYQFKENYEG